MAQQIISYTLSRLDAADSFAFARIDAASFSEKDKVAKQRCPDLCNDEAELAGDLTREGLDHKLGKIIGVCEVESIESRVFQFGPATESFGETNSYEPVFPVR